VPRALTWWRPSAPTENETALRNDKRQTPMRHAFTHCCIAAAVE